MHIVQAVIYFLGEISTWQEIVKIDRCGQGPHSLGQQPQEENKGNRNYKKIIE